jgi:hypothetical protein
MNNKKFFKMRKKIKEAKAFQRESEMGFKTERMGRNT